MINEFFLGELLISGVQISFLVAQVNTLIKPSYVPRGSSLITTVGLFIIAVGFVIQNQWFASATCFLSVFFWSAIFIFRGSRSIR